MHNLEREELANLLGYHLTTVKQWETESVLPKPQSIKKICNSFDISLSYFDNYYRVYFSNYIEKINQWKKNSNYTNLEITKILNINYSNLIKLLNGKIALSKGIYQKLLELKVSFSEHKQRI